MSPCERASMALAVSVPLGLAGLFAPQAPGWGRAWAQSPTALDKLRADDGTAGKLQEINLDQRAAKVDVARGVPLGPGNERAVFKQAPPAAAPPPARPADRQALDAQINQRLRDVELCRANRARTESTAPAPLLLRWTILPDGRTKNPVVVSERPTELDVMKCVRKRMEAWQFTPTATGPMEVESSYSFAPIEVTPAAPAPPPGKQPVVEQPRHDQPARHPIKPHAPDR